MEMINQMDLVTKIVVILIILSICGPVFNLLSYLPGFLRVGLSGREVIERIRYSTGLNCPVYIGGGAYDGAYDMKAHEIIIGSKIPDSRNVMSASTVAHECGHALTQYRLVSKIRNAFVPVINILNLVILPLIIAGEVSDNPVLSIISLICYGVYAGYWVITLFDEINASRAGIRELKNNGIFEHKIATVLVLILCGMTYFCKLLREAFLLRQILSLVFIVLSIFGGGDDDDF